MQSAAQFAETFRVHCTDFFLFLLALMMPQSPTHGREKLRTWDDNAIDHVRPMIATAVMYHLL